MKGRSIVVHITSLPDDPRCQKAWDLYLDNLVFNPPELFFCRFLGHSQR